MEEPMRQDLVWGVNDEGQMEVTFRLPVTPNADQMSSWLAEDFASCIQKLADRAVPDGYAIRPEFRIGRVALTPTQAGLIHTLISIGGNVMIEDDTLQPLLVEQARMMYDRAQAEIGGSSEQLTEHLNRIMQEFVHLIEATYSVTTEVPDGQ